MHTLGQAKTKLILFGEHAAVYGFPAVGLSLPWRVCVEISPSDKNKWNTLPLDIKHTGKLETLLHTLPKIFPKLNSKGPFEITVKSDAPIGIGFGSSGALCTALARCFCLALELNTQHSDNIPQLSLWHYAHELEKVFHLTPSGIDTGISIYETLCSFEKSNGPLPSCHQLTSINLPLIIGALPRQADTASIISALKERIEKKPSYHDHICKLGHLSSEAISALKKTNENPLEFLGNLATEAQKHLETLGLSTPELSRLIEYGISCGAMGGKLSGAGCGGAYFLLAKTHLEAQQITTQMRHFAEKNQINHALLPTTHLNG